jgi:DNA-directed RNA polymerase
MTLWAELSEKEQDDRKSLQSVWEEELLDGGVQRYWKEYERATDEGKPEQLLLESAVLHLTPYYQQWIDSVCENRKSPQWLTPLLTLGAAKMADITIRSMIKMFLSKYNLVNINYFQNVPLNAPTGQQVSKQIAEDTIAIVSYQSAKKKFKEDWTRQSKFIKNWTPKRCRAFTLKMLGLPDYTTKQREDFGHNMLRIALQSGILNSHVIWTGRKKKAMLVSFAPEILKELHTRHQLLETGSMVYRPMICPPVNHTTEKDGGFLSPWLRKKMVKRYHPVGAKAKDWESTPSPEVLDGVNALMQTEWSVNKRVYEVMKHLFVNDHRTANLPSYSFKDFAFSRPYPEEGTKKEQAEWMAESTEAWGSWYKEEQSRSRMLVRLDLAERLIKYGFFYMPYTLDFRGRAYTVCELLSCQGIDFDRGLVWFAKPIKQTERGLYWLKVHLANLFDQDKKTYEERVAWVDDNMDMFYRIAEDPYINTDWVSDVSKKNPSFQRLAAIFDLCRTDGMTQLPVQKDGKNNGVQHWSAIMRDKMLADLTNVIPSDEPKDLYQHVADKSYHVITTNEDDVEWFDRFKSHWSEELPRKVTKRPTMCDAYGLTFYGMQKYVKEEGHLDWVSREEIGGAIVELSRAIQAGLSNTMEEPNKGKDYLRVVARLISSRKQPLVWETKSGFVVHHVYNQVIERISYAELFNKQQLVFASLSEELDDDAQYLAVSPNFIHSLDAAHMFLTICRMLEHNITGYSFVHDSYGTYGPYVDKMDQILRETFVEIHKGNPLEDFKNHLEKQYACTLPEVPQRQGDFDITEVLNSEYFFS